MRTTAISLLAVGVAMVACNGEETVQMDDKAAYETAIVELKEKVALIAIYLPHLDKPKVQKYDPEKRTDLDRACSFAANEIRHAANSANQHSTRSKSQVVKELAPHFATISKICANLEGDEAIATCKAGVNKLDATLQEYASKASAAGATGKFPRIAAEFITDNAKNAIKPFVQAKGPGKEEAKYLAMRRDPKVAPDILAMACDAAANEAGATMKAMTAAGNDEVRKVSAHHKAAVDGQCNRTKGSAALVATLTSCKERLDDVKKDEDLEAECVLACSKTKGRIKRGIPAAPFEPLVGLNEDVCKELAKDQDK